MEDLQIQKILEFDKIKEIIASKAACSLGKNRVKDVRKLDNLAEIQMDLLKCDEAMRLLYRYGTIPLGGLADIAAYVHKASIDGILFPMDLLAIVGQIDVINNCQNYIHTSEITTNTISEMLSNLVLLKDLKSKILKCISMDGDIYDNASSNLLRIRKNIRSLEQNIRTKMNQYLVSLKDVLSENLITSRNDRFVLPVKSSYRYQVKGIVHDQSSSRQTIYIEPDAVVVMNNQLQELKMDEEKEIERILFTISQLVKEDQEELRNNQTILAEIDFIFAKASFGKQIDGCIAEISDQYDKLRLKKARHPLIAKEDVIANDIFLEEPHHVLLITGSNTGGKTVTLKTVGLLSYMSLAGIPIPCVEALIPYFDCIFVDLGDEQSIEQSLSTFSSHMQRIVDITDHVTHKSLVLLDEVGSGTDPKEGESLAQAILEFFHGFKCQCIATTHYSKLKRYAQSVDYILSACVEFDEEAFKPTYRLILGVVGRSYALEISRRLQLNEHIVANALAIKTENQSREDIILEELEKSLDIAHKKEIEYEDLIHELLQQKEAILKEKQQLETNREKLLEEAKKEANKILQMAKNDVDFILEELRQKQYEIKPHHGTDAKRQLDILQHEHEKKNQENNYDNYQVGDIVRLNSLHREAEIVECKRDGSFTLSLGGLYMHVNKEDISFIKKTKKEKKKSSPFTSVIRKTGSYECNVIGMRYEEAMSVVDKFIDDAVVSGYPSIRIVHGMGTGALRNGVHQLLRKNKVVISFRDGGPQEGGLGATIVKFTKDD